MPKQTAVPSYEEIDATITNDCQFYQTPRKMALKAISAKLTAAEWSLWAYWQVDPKALNLASPDEIAKKIGDLTEQVRHSAVRLVDLGLVPAPAWLEVKPVQRIEKQIRDHLHAELGGLVEVATSAGRVGLLTDKEIIEVKAIKDWKAALAQVLVYSAFYPEHQKQLYLFETAKELEALSDIEAAVLRFEAEVTGEEVA